jgi:hypothetical protein
MKMRCYSRGATRYAEWGGRGIRVCHRWLTFENFLADMGERPSSSHSIDRIDPDGNYELGNCRWATRSEQQRNRRDSVKLTALGRTMTLYDWADETGISAKTLYSRVHTEGWSHERAVTERVRRVQ